MSYLSALKEANEIIEIIEYFQCNKDKLDENGELTFNHNGGLITLIDFENFGYDVSEFDNSAKYINYIPSHNKHVYYDAQDKKYIFQEDDYKDCSTEEGYFQKSTLYTEDVLDVLVLLDCLSKEISVAFYFDPEYIEVTKQYIKDGKKC